jgi:GNAT superfamily N-acetyltransferase
LCFGWGRSVCWDAQTGTLCGVPWDVDVAAVAEEVTLPLRRSVLRPHMTIEELARAGHAGPDALWCAAYDDIGEIVGTGSVSRGSPPWALDESAWRIRAMAVAPERRGRGIGSAVLAMLVDHVRRHGGCLTWCYARMPARAFYARAGFVAVGDVFQIEHIGPHISMALLVDDQVPQL